MRLRSYAHLFRSGIRGVNPRNEIVECLLSIHHSHIDHNAPCLFPPPPPPPQKKNCITIVSISPGYYNRPRRNQRQKVPRYKERLHITSRPSYWYPKNLTAAMLVFQTDPVGVLPSTYVYVCLSQ